MSFFGMVFNYMLRVNINLAIVAMVKAKNDSNSTMENDVCGYGEEMEDGSSDSVSTSKEISSVLTIVGIDKL